MNEINERIRAVLNYSEMNKKKFSEKLGIAASTVGDVILNKKGPGVSFIQRIVESFPEINALWLICGKGDMLITKQLLYNIQEQNNVAEEPANSHSIQCERLKWHINDLDKDISELKNNIQELKKENKELIEENAVLRYLVDGGKKTTG